MLPQILGTKKPYGTQMHEIHEICLFFSILFYEKTHFLISAGQGHSQKWPKERVLRPEIVKELGFEGAEALRICAQASFC